MYTQSIIYNVLSKNKKTNFFFHLKIIIFTAVKYYTIIDFNEVDIRIYLPEKVIVHRGR